MFSWPCQKENKNLEKLLWKDRTVLLSCTFAHEWKQHGHANVVKAECSSTSWFYGFVSILHHVFPSQKGHDEWSSLPGRPENQPFFRLVFPKSEILVSFLQKQGSTDSEQIIMLSMQMQMEMQHAYLRVLQSCCLGSVSVIVQWHLGQSLSSQPYSGIFTYIWTMRQPHSKLKCNLPFTL